MSGPDILTSNLTRAQMTQADLRSKLRLAGVSRYEHVAAVILEATGEVSVLTSTPEGPPPEPELFTNVRGAESLHTDTAARPPTNEQHHQP